MNSDHLKAAAEKYDKKMRSTDPEMNGLSMREEAFIAGAEFMRSEITELERKLGICVEALEFYGNKNNYSEVYHDEDEGAGGGLSGDIAHLLDLDDVEYGYDSSGDLESANAGKTARTALAAVRDSEGG